VAILLGLLLAWVSWSAVRNVVRGGLSGTTTPAIKEVSGPCKEEAWRAVVGLNRATVLYAPSGDLHLVAPYLDLTGPAYEEFKVAQQERADQGILRRSAHGKVTLRQVGRGYGDIWRRAKRGTGRLPRGDR
jgi:hypothetical protein